MEHTKEATYVQVGTWLVAQKLDPSCLGPDMYVSCSISSLTSSISDSLHHTLSTISSWCVNPAMKHDSRFTTSKDLFIKNHALMVHVWLNQDITSLHVHVPMLWLHQDLYDNHSPPDLIESAFWICILKFLWKPETLKPHVSGDTSSKRLDSVWHYAFSVDLLLTSVNQMSNFCESGNEICLKG